MNSKLDLRKWAILFSKRIWTVIVAVVVCAALGAITYIAYTSITDGEPKYMISSDYYIIFNEAEYPNGMDFYNAYTWNQFVTDDKIVNCALDNASSVSKDDIKNSVSSLMMSDYRILTVRVTGTDQNMLSEINEAYKIAMPAFAEEVKELTSIELWSCDDMIQVNEHIYTKNAAFLGAIIGLLVSLFAWAVKYCLDDRIYVETDIELDDVTFLGYDTEGYSEDVEKNKAMYAGDRDVFYCSNVSEELEEIKKHDVCIINIPMGQRRLTALKYDVDLLKKQKCELAGVVMIACDKKFLNCYYGSRK